MLQRRIFVCKWTGALVATVALCVTFPTISRARMGSGSPFSLSGSAQPVTGGPGPNNLAVDLTSNCGAQAFSITCFTHTPPFTSSDVTFTPSGSMTVGDITTLSTDFNVGGSDCGGPSPRFSVTLNNNKSIFVYFGPIPISNPGNCFYGWQNTGNVTTSSDPRVDTTQLGGVFNDTWSNAVGLAGSTPVSSNSVVVDGGWTVPRGQDVTIDNFTVNKSVMNGANVH